MSTVLRLLLPAMVLLTIGCAPYREYYGIDVQASQTDTYSAVMNALTREGFEVVEEEELEYYGQPEIYLETAWNQRDHVIRGNSVRRQAYVRIITLYREEQAKPEFQPLPEDATDETPEDRKAREAEEARKRASLEHHRVLVAVRLEQLSDIRRPIESDWRYVGPDTQMTQEILARLEMIFQEGRGAGEPSRKSIEIRKKMMEEESR